MDEIKPETRRRVCARIVGRFANELGNSTVAVWNFTIERVPLMLLALSIPVTPLSAELLYEVVQHMYTPLLHQTTVCFQTNTGYL
ncbi:uncharacterized protein MEPE_05291 [Melanopsichium pennsylvanicum]|uniref:Uncharacterized protein n=1 Tax=Melanopsichium pennsylvanicum TaxID=63383 RepID=A0AAJ5C761_9BASI|nr:uncharacterized protein MEPE_05291 [Melanopsichium pennsylvanicum]